MITVRLSAFAEATALKKPDTRLRSKQFPRLCVLAVKT